MLTHSRVALLFSSLLVISAIAYGQSVAPAPPPAPGRIYVDVVVTPQDGKPVSGLQQQDFTVLDNKVAKPITSFTSVEGVAAPGEVILVIDTVNAGYQTVAYAREQMTKFLRANEGELPHPVTLAVLTDKGVQIQQGSSRSGKELAAALEKYDVMLRTIRRSAGFYGAEERLQISLQAMNGLVEREAVQPGHKAIVWVSPGWPLFSGPRVQFDSAQQQQLFGQVAGLSTEIRKARVTVYSVDPLGSSESLFRSQAYKEYLNGVTKPSQVAPGNLGLQVLAIQSGGLALSSNNDISDMLQRVMNDTRAFYEISFDAAPGDKPDEYRRVDVKIAKPGLVARTSSGYYTQPLVAIDKTSGFQQAR